MWSPFSLFELPLLRRELLEASHKRRTYALRAIIAMIHVVGFLLYYFSVYSRKGSIRQFSGEGVKAVEIQVLIDLLAIVLLLPAMACSAISGEREKQTLGLLLISRIRPFALVIEKLLSRLLPMTTLLLITVPMLGVAFLLGGVELANVLMILCLLLTAAIQVASVAILCSSVLNSALDAFWATYVVLAGMYFIPGILLDMIGVRPIVIVPTLDSAQLQYFCMSYLLALGGSLRGSTSMTAAAISCLPPLSISVMMLVGASRFVVRTGSGSALETGRAASGFVAATWKMARRLVGWPFVLGERWRDWFWANGHFLVLRRKSIAAIETDVPIAWREANSTLLASWKLHVPLLLTVLFLQWWSFPEVIGRTHQAEEICVITDAAVLLLGLMMIAGTGCRTFAAERSRETLDVLLTTPTQNRDLLNQKLSAVNRIRWFILFAIFITGLVHLFVVDMTYLYGRFPVRWQTSYDYIIRHSRNQAWGYLSANFLYSLLHAFVYLTIMKWSAVLFSLLFRTQIKAMMATLVTIIAVCSLPFVGTMIPLVLQSIVPERFPAFLFSSPLIIWGLNETGELRTLVQDFYNRRSGVMTSGMSEAQLVVTNLFIYGSVALILKYSVILMLPRLLGRRDTVAESDADA